MLISKPFKTSITNSVNSHSKKRNPNPPTTTLSRSTIMNDLRRGFHILWHLRIPTREEVEPGTKRGKMEEQVNGI